MFGILIIGVRELKRVERVGWIQSNQAGQYQNRWTIKSRVWSYTSEMVNRMPHTVRASKGEKKILILEKKVNKTNALHCLHTSFPAALTSLNLISDYIESPARRPHGKGENKDG